VAQGASIRAAVFGTTAGVARVIALVDPGGGNPDGPKAVKLLDANLARVPSRVLSPAGRAGGGT
jgi:hypothetical protein